MAKVATLTTLMASARVQKWEVSTIKTGSCGDSAFFDDTDGVCMCTKSEVIKKCRLSKIIPLNLFTNIHDGNFRRHLSMNVTIK